MGKILGITTFIIVLLVGFLGITYSYEYNDDESLAFELLGDYKVYLNLNDRYEEYGVKVFMNGIDVSNQVIIDSSSVNTSEVGEYKVRYEVNVLGNVEYIYRVVIVRENIKPVIKLIGDETLYLNLNEIYYEPGYIASDNYDVDIDKKVSITSNLETNKIGEYKIEYSVIDSSGNKAFAVRKIIVK